MNLSLGILAFKFFPNWWTWDPACESAKWTDCVLEDAGSSLRQTELAHFRWPPPHGFEMRRNFIEIGAILGLIIRYFPDVPPINIWYFLGSVHVLVTLGLGLSFFCGFVVTALIAISLATLFLWFSFWITHRAPYLIIRLSLCGILAHGICRNTRILCASETISLLPGTWLPPSVIHMESWGFEPFVTEKCLVNIIEDAERLALQTSISSSW